MLPLLRSRQSPYVIGHRGAKGHAPENTLAAFRKAAELGADIVECDVHLSRDDRLVVIHDERVERTTGGAGRVRELELAELKRLDAGGGEPVPALEDVLDWIAPSELGIAIEIKGNLSLYPGISEKVVNALLARGLVDRAIVISFDYAAVHEARDLCRELATGLLFAKRLRDPVAAARETHAGSLWPSLRILSPELVTTAHAHGLGVFTWTANRDWQLRHALECEVDGIGSDFPERVRDRLRPPAPLRRSAR